MNEMEQFIQKMPKAELHLHIEGSLEPELKFELAQRNSIDLPYNTVEEVKESYNFDSLTTFLVGYYEGMGLLITEKDFYDLTTAYLQKAKEQNITHAEIFFDPQGHTDRGIAFDTVIKGIHKALLDGEQNYGISSELIMCFLRDKSAASAMKTLEESLPYKDWILAVGLDSDERDNPPVKFKEVFDKAREEGYITVAHCDVNQQDSVAHIWEALNLLKVSRIDHGVNSLEDPKLVEVIRERHLALTVCPISNLGVTGDMQEKAVKEMMDKDMCVTINSDDPAYFQTYVNENFVALQKALDLTKKDLYTLARNSFEGSLLDKKEKKAKIAELDLYYARNL